MLMEQIQAVGRPCEKRLLTLLRDESDAIPEEARMTAIGLLRDMGSTLPKMLYIQWQLNREMKDDWRTTRWTACATWARKPFSRCWKT